VSARATRRLERAVRVLEKLLASMPKTPMATALLKGVRPTFRESSPGEVWASWAGGWALGPHVGNVTCVTEVSQSARTDLQVGSRVSRKSCTSEVMYVVSLRICSRE
jgi:hypothetical protein